MLNILPDWKYSSWLFYGVLLVCFFVSAGIRFQQFDTWEKNPAAYFVGDRPIMTTLDAPYWLRMAREYNEGTFGQKESLRTYPEGKKPYVPLKYTDATLANSSSSLVDFFTHPHQARDGVGISYRSVPLLSFLIAHLTPFFNYNYYLTGTLLIPTFASLFILPLGIYFFRIGIPLSGLLGGLIGTFAGGYYMRSSIGRIDTDMLNLFFPTIAALLILLASQAKSERAVLLYSIGTGLSIFLFHWWYNKAGFTLIYFAVLVISLVIQQIRFKTVLLSALLFVLCTNPGIFINGTNNIQYFLESYFPTVAVQEVLIENRTTPASFPNTMTTISEVDRVPIEEVFRRILSNQLLNWAGFLAFFLLMVLRWRALLPLAPMLALGLLSFHSSNRFIMYLGPFIGIGLGWLLSIVIEGAFIFWPRKHSESIGNESKGKSKKVERYKLKRKNGSMWIRIIYWLSMDTGSTKNGVDQAKWERTKVKEERLKKKGPLYDGRGNDWFGLARQGTLYLGMGVFFWGISSQTAISFVPAPSIHPRIYSTFFEVKNRVPKNSALLSWWDYGYAITDATGLATFHDGGGQTSPKTYFIARSLISQDQDELYDITQYLATESNRGIAENNTSPEALLKTIRNSKHKPSDPIYLFFTADMTGKYGAISKLGSWDTVKGESHPSGYRNLACNKITNEEMSCRGATIDLKSGKINNQVLLRRLVFIRDGQVLREQTFGHNRGHTLQLRVAGRQIVEVQLIDEGVFRSNYNQIFLLGRYQKDLFEETYNAFPFSRLFKFKF